jgi:hypothetical protein
MGRMSALRWILAPYHAAALLTGAKSFRDNPILGSRLLNEKGLHVARMRLAHRMAQARRDRLSSLIGPDDATAFARDGFIEKRDFLPREFFAALRREALETSAPARDTRQGDTITRRIPIDAVGRRRMPAVAKLATDPAFLNLVRYVGASKLTPLVFVQTIFSQVYAVEPDPQTELHADTFHPTVKAWLFLNDVPADEGPFVYVPGSHLATSERLAWERRTAMGAAQSPSFLTARGSFRIGREELAGIGLPRPRVFDVPANTLVVADTGGFHARGLSLRPSVRSEIFAYGRRGPFIPWTGLDPLAAPLITGRASRIGWAMDDLKQRFTGKWASWQNAGETTATEPPELMIHFDLAAVRRLEEARIREAGL